MLFSGVKCWMEKKKYCTNVYFDASVMPIKDITF